MYWYAIDWLDAISLFLDPVEAILRETETILGKSRDGQGNPPGVFLGRLIPTPLLSPHYEYIMVGSDLCVS